MKIRFQQVFVAVTAALGIAILSAPGCGGSADTCEGVATKLCEKACACGGGKCSFNQGSGPFTINSQAECEALLKAGCSNPMGTVDYSACSTALDSAQCQSSALVEPSVCNASSGSGGGGSSSSAASGGSDAGAD